MSESLPKVEAGAQPFAVIERVRFGDLDAMQHMNNVEFLRYFETARIAYVSSRFPEHTPTSRDRFGFIFAECLISYRSPAHYGEEIRTRVWPLEIGSSSLKLGFEMHALGDERLVAEGYGVLVGYDYAEGRSRRLPDDVRAKLERDVREPA
jgi:acyl-CoA thioester hydrolase